jgi:hypothetical protein
MDGRMLLSSSLAAGDLSRACRGINHGHNISYLDAEIIGSYFEDRLQPW